jgi:hypothetical protein
MVSVGGATVAIVRLHARGDAATHPSVAQTAADAGLQRPRSSSPGGSAVSELKDVQNHEAQLSLSAKTFLEVLLRLRSGESLLLCIDEKSDPSVVAAISGAAMDATASCRVLELGGDSSLSDAAARIAAAIGSQACDVLCELGEHSYYQSGVWSAAMAAGAI